MSSRDVSPIDLSILIVSGGLLLGFCFISWKLASYMGVGFTTVVSSLGLTLLWSLVGVVSYFWLALLPRSWYLLLAICLIWPSWFPVVREIAENHAFPFQFVGLETTQSDLPWWGRNITLYCSELVLIISIVGAVLLTSRSRY